MGGFVIFLIALIDWLLISAVCAIPSTHAPDELAKTDAFIEVCLPLPLPVLILVVCVLLCVLRARCHRGSQPVAPKPVFVRRQSAVRKIARQIDELVEHNPHTRYELLTVRPGWLVSGGEGARADE